MQIKCDYCGGYISEKDQYCPHCGGVNAGFKRSSDGTPKTISELKIWYDSKNLPPEKVTRFFIGKNVTEPRAFGIYEENGEFIVYKNKDDGSRAIRYSGSDEAYAVNELYLKLKSEILNQKAHNLSRKNVSGNSVFSQEKSNKICGLIIFGFICFGMIMSIISLIADFIHSSKDAPYAGNYYKNGTSIYYCESYVDDEWYQYDSYSRDYIPVTIPREMYENIQDYRYADNEEWDQNIQRFEDSSTGQYVNSVNDSSDSDYSWDSSDSWDSDSTDWGSDW